MALAIRAEHINPFIVSNMETFVKMVGMDAKPGKPMLRKDAIGELANIVAGAAKKDLTQYKISISLPTVIVGDGHEVMGGKEVIPLAVPFDSPFGKFSLIVAFKSEV